MAKITELDPQSTCRIVITVSVAELTRTEIKKIFQNIRDILNDKNTTGVVEMVDIRKDG